MRQSSAIADDIPIPLPVTYTPATHRISKAKKGKRVHACQHPGCNKVFTRAEHRRRHEVNHNPDAWYRCGYPGCKKSFRRRDLFTRHTEKHESESQMEKNNAGQWKTQHQVPLGSSEESGDSKRVPLDPNAGPFFQTVSSAPMGPIIASEIHPNLAHGCSPMWNHGMEMLLQPRSYMFQNPIQEETATAESPFYSPPETCASPSSDGTTFDLRPFPVHPFFQTQSPPMWDGPPSSC